MPPQSNTSKRRTEPVRPVRKKSTTSDDFGDDGIDDDELMKVSIGDLEFEHIDNFANPMDAVTRKNTAKNKATKSKPQPKPTQTGTDDDDQDPVQLANGKWACSHKCKDKTACKHLCCKTGMDKPSKKSAAARRRASNEEEPSATQSTSTQKVPQKQSKLQLTASKRKISSAIEELDLSQQEKKKKADYANNGPRDYRDLHQLHKNIQKKDPPSSLHSIMHKKPGYCYSQGGEYNLSFLQQPGTRRPESSSDYGDIPLDDMSSHIEPSQPTATQHDTVQYSEAIDENEFMDYSVKAPVRSRESDLFGDDDSLLGDALVGLADSQNLKEVSGMNDSMATEEGVSEIDYGNDFDDDDFAMDVEDEDQGNNTWQSRDESPAPVDQAAMQKSMTPFDDSTSSPQPPINPFKPAKATLQDHNRKKFESTPYHLARVKAGNLELLKPDAKPSNTRVKDDETQKRQSFVKQGCSKFSKPKAPQHAPRPEPNIQAMEDIDVLDFLNDLDDAPAKLVKSVDQMPKGLEDLDPWLFAEFGDVVELVDE